MKKLLSVNHASTNTDIAILLLRVVIAGLMLTHGIPKLASLVSGDIQFPPLLGLSAKQSLALAVFAEVFCSVFILIGLGTRMATLPLIITMVVALLFVHAADPFAKQELAYMYLLPYVVLLITGSGRFSVDYMVQQRPAKHAVA